MSIIRDHCISRPALLNMYYVYVLKSLKYKGKFYIGFTSDLKRRLEEHISGKTYTTRRMLPIELAYYEAYKSKSDAQNREHQLKKHGNALGHLKRRLTKSL